jgi:DNA primase
VKIPPIHPDTIADVKASVDILEIVGGHVVLKKRGKDYLGLCPFHDEKSPSFSVNPAKNMYYCFGCQAGGDGISFVSKLLGKSFTDTIVDLANHYQIEIKTLEPDQTKQLQAQISRRDLIHKALDLARVYFQQQLNRDLNVSNYLTSDRHLDIASIQSWQIGLAPSGWSSLYDHLSTTKNIPTEIILAAGLAIANKDNTGYYDRFRDRLMIPICDLNSRIIGFGARTMSDQQPKYLNSPETELFTKGTNLFGLDRARTQIIKLDRAIVVEGYFDAIALHQAGITNVVASLGTALNPHQIKQLAKLTRSNQIILNFDGDNAGQLATERAITAVSDLIYSGQLQLRVLNLDAGKDADEYLRDHSLEQYRTALDRAPLWLDWQLSQIIKDCDFGQADQYIYTSNRIVELLSKISDLTTRIYYIHQAAVALSNGNTRSISALTTSLKHSIQQQVSKPSSTPEIIIPPRSLVYNTELLVLQIYLKYPQFRLLIIDRIDTAPIKFTCSGFNLVWQEITSGDHAYNDPDLDQYLYHLTDFDPDLGLLFYPDPNTDNVLALDLDQTQETITTALNILQRLELETQIADLVKRLRIRSIDNNPSVLHTLIGIAKSKLLELS